MSASSARPWLQQPSPGVGPGFRNAWESSMHCKPPPTVLPARPKHLLCTSSGLGRADALPPSIQMTSWASCVPQRSGGAPAAGSRMPCTACCLFRPATNLIRRRDTPLTHAATRSRTALHLRAAAAGGGCAAAALHPSRLRLGVDIPIALKPLTVDDGGDGCTFLLVVPDIDAGRAGRRWLARGVVGGYVPFATP